MKYLLGLLVAALLLLWAMYSAYPSFSVKPPRSASHSDACYMAQKFVTDSLKAPTTAKFPPAREPDCRVSQRKRIWIVSSYVDAQNGFGAMIRSDYQAEMIYYPATAKWTLVDLSIGSR